MHKSAERLFEVWRAKGCATGAEIARALGATDQDFWNWKQRGVPARSALAPRGPDPIELPDRRAIWALPIVRFAGGSPGLLQSLPDSTLTCCALRRSAQQRSMRWPPGCARLRDLCGPASLRRPTSANISVIIRFTVRAETAALVPGDSRQGVPAQREHTLRH